MQAIAHAPLAFGTPMMLRYAAANVDRSWSNYLLPNSTHILGNHVAAIFSIGSSLCGIPIPPPLIEPIGGLVILAICK